MTVEERESPQEIELDVELEADCETAAASDDIRDAVDYLAIFRACERNATEGSFALLEALAGACLEDIMSDDRIATATVRVRKPGLLSGATPEIELSRRRTGR